MILSLCLRCPKHVSRIISAVDLVGALTVHKVSGYSAAACFVWYSSRTYRPYSASPRIIFKFFLVQAFLTQWTRCHCLISLNTAEVRAIFFTLHNSMIHQPFMTSPCAVFSVQKYCHRFNLHWIRGSIWQLYKCAHKTCRYLTARNKVHNSGYSHQMKKIFLSCQIDVAIT